jgi:hypothetical protein
MSWSYALDSELRNGTPSPRKVLKSLYSKMSGGRFQRTALAD